MICSGESALISIESELTTVGDNSYTVAIQQQLTTAATVLTSGTLTTNEEIDTLFDGVLENGTMIPDTLLLEVVNFIESTDGGANCEGDTVYVEIVVEPAPSFMVTLEAEGDTENASDGTITQVICSGDSALIHIESDLTTVTDNSYQVTVEGSIAPLSDLSGVLVTDEPDTILNQGIFTNTTTDFDTVEIEIINFIDNGNTPSSLDAEDCIGDTVLVFVIVEPAPMFEVSLEADGEEITIVNDTLRSVICSGESALISIELSLIHI